MREVERRRKVLEAQIAALRAEFESESEGINSSLATQRSEKQEDLGGANRKRRVQSRSSTGSDLPVANQCSELEEPTRYDRLRILLTLMKPNLPMKGSGSSELYVAGQTPKSLAAFANLKKICEEHLAGKYRIEIIDLLENPRLARGDQILAIPTLVRKLPEPVKKIIGDLSNTERVLVGLDLRPSDADIIVGVGKQERV